MVDTMIRLFESTATNFDSNGLGTLSDASKCEVVEERNGSFELELDYHISGKRYRDIELRRIIVAKPNPYEFPQPFRIYNISKPINGLVTVRAEHLSYDMSGYPVKPFYASDIRDALQQIKANTIVENLFGLFTDFPDKESDEEPYPSFELLKPASMRAVLGGSENSILDIYGGELEFKNFSVALLRSRGKDRGVTIRYGKNMTDLTQEENCADVYTAVYPYFYSDEFGLRDLPETFVQAPGTYDYVRVYPLDVSSEWDNEQYEWTDEYAAQEEIRGIAKKYIADNNLGVPKVSLTVSFEQLSKSEEYASLELLETVRLCDTVTVEFPKLNVSAKSKCIKTTYNVLTDKYVSIELGDVKSNLANSIVSQNASVDRKIENTPTKKAVAQEIKSATQLISGGLGGCVVIHSSGNSGYPDEILIMDTDDITTAKKVWRWNRGGLGYSSTGYNGTYDTAITQDGSIVADFIKTGELTANLIRGGILTVGGLDNADGAIEIRDSAGNLLIKLSVNGIEFFRNGGAAVTKIVDDTLATTNVTATNLKVKAANVTGTLTAEQIDATNLKVDAANINGTIVADSFRYKDDNYVCEVSNGFEIYNKSEGVSTSYGIKGVHGSMILNSHSLNFYAGTNYNGANGSLIFESDSFLLDKPLDIGTGSILAGDGYATIVDCTNKGIFYYGASKDYVDVSSLSALRGNKVRIYSHSGGAVYLGLTGSTAITSDENLKNIYEIDSRYEEFFRNLTPIIYSYKNHGHRRHIGYGARAVEKALADAGLTTEEFAGIVIDRDVTIGADEMETEKDVHFDELYYLRYEEFGALYAHMLQLALQKIDRQQKEIDDLRTRLDEVFTYINSERM